MTSIRFIHCADLHLDRPFRGMDAVPNQMAAWVRESTFRSFHRIVDAAIGHQVDFVVIAGDLFDEEYRSLRAQARFRDEMKRLSDSGIEVFAVHGNHDFLGGNRAPLGWPDNVHIFGPDVEMMPFAKKGTVLAHLYGFSYRERAVTDRQALFYEKAGSAPFHIGILHGQEEAGSGEHASYAPFTVRELLDQELNYWALGHIHKRQVLNEEPVVSYPGNIQGLNPKETGEKGCFLVEMDEKATELSFIPTADIEWAVCEISVSEAGNSARLLEICEQELEKLRKEKTGTLAVIDFVGSGPLHAYLLQEENLEDLLSALREGEEARENFVWPASCRVKTVSHWDRDKLKQDDHFIGDLLRLLDEEGAEDALDPLVKNRRAKRFLSEPDDHGRREILKEAETLLLTELLREGEPE
ncbi:MAG TPA: DNA repair exonuclease [Bacillales bacterium]|nr:DNA repair exonuclease [Bacillales bacterium]